MRRMKPLIKWFLLGLAALLVLGVAVLIAVATLVDPAQYRTAVADAVQQSTGRALSLGGEVGLKLLPCCAVELEQVALGNPPGFPAEPFLSIKSARLAIRLWPLLTRREVEIGTVSIDGLRANLLGRKDGSNNWSFTRLAKDNVAGDAKEATGSLAGFNLAGISIRDASLNYSDEADGSRYRVEQIQLTTGGVRDGKPFDLGASFRLTDLADNSGVSARLKAQTRVLLAGDVTTISLTRLDAELDTIGLAGLDTLTGRLKAPAVEVRLGRDTLLNAPELTADLQLKGADLPGGSAPLAATATDLRYDVDADTGAVSALAAKTTLAGVALEVEGVGTFGTSNDLRGTLRFPAFSPREVLPKLEQKIPDTADPDVLRRLSGSANWFLRDKVAGLEKLALVLDDTNISGSLSQELLPVGSKATPRRRFDLTIDAFNADRYLVPDPAPAPKSDDSQQRQPPTEIPAGTLRALNLEGRARIGRLTLNKLQLADVDVTTSANAGLVRLDPLAAKLYGGAFRGGISLDATGAKTRVTLDHTLSSVNLGALLTDVADVKNITGTMNLRLDGTAIGATDDELLGNLGGNLALSLADGVYKGMDIWYEIRRARALLRRTAPPARSGPGETPIRILDLAGKLSNGELRTDRFNAEIPFLRVSGAATLNLPNSRLDSNLTALVFEKPVFPDDNTLEDLVNVSIPLTVSGPIDNPKVRVDLGKMVKGALKETLRETLQDKLREQLGLGKTAEEAPPAEGEQATPTGKKQEDPLKKALDRLFRP
jgi:AsmA protein